MDARKINHSECCDPLLYVRWSEKYNVSLLEQKVALIRREGLEWVISCPVRILEKTQVYLTGDGAMGNGIVRFCRREGTAYMLTISMSVEPPFIPPRQEFDPGILAIDDFLTEEEEAKILDSLKDEIPCSVMSQRLVHCWANLHSHLARLLLLPPLMA